MSPKPPGKKNSSLSDSSSPDSTTRTGETLRTPAIRKTELFLTLIALIIFGFATTAQIPAQTLTLWKAGIAATEFGHLFAIPVIFLAIVVLTVKSLEVRKKRRYATAAFLGVSVALLLSPTFEANKISIENLTWLGGFQYSIFTSYFPPTLVRITPQDVRFNRPDGSEGKFLFYPADLAIGGASVPDRTAGAPLIVVVHGGGWDSGDPSQLSDLNSVLAHQGYAVAAVNYRLLPGHKWPTPKDDVVAAIQHIRRNFGEFKIGPDKIVLLGRSAGGQIAETIAYDPPAELITQGISAIKGIIGFYSPADMNFAYEFGKEDDILESRPLLRKYLAGTPETAKENYHTASGFDFVTKSSPPTLLIHGQHDDLVWFKQSERLYKKLKDAGATAYFLALPWATHGFDYNLYGPGGQLSTQAVLAFLKTVI